MGKYDNKIKTNMLKKLNCFLLITIIFTNSCVATKYLHRDMSYDETFTGFFISKDQQDIIFMGEKYDYIFKDDANIINNLIELSWKNKLAIKEIFLEAYDQDVKGHIIVATNIQDAGFTKEQLNFLESKGFRKYRERLEITINVKGIRYEPAPYSNADQNKSKFNKSYSTKIKQNISNGRRAARIAATPISVAADGAIIYLGVALWPITLVILANKRNKKRY